jgi:predicted exporter
MRKVLDVTAWTGGKGRTYFCLADNGAVEQVARALPAWQQWAANRGTNLSWHGVAPQIHRSALSIRRLSAAAVPSMALLVGVMVTVFARRWQLAVLAVCVALLPVAALVVAAVILRCRLDPVTLVIGSITTGVAVDDTLHLLGTFRRRGSMRRAVIESWRPCVGSSLAAAVCFICFSLSRFAPTAQFGSLMAAATILAMISNQVLLPAAVERLPHRRRRAPPYPGQPTR